MKVSGVSTGFSTGFPQMLMISRFLAIKNHQLARLTSSFFFKYLS